MKQLGPIQWKFISEAFTSFLTEKQSPAAEEAKRRGLESAGYGNWRVPGGDVVAKSVDGGKKLVKVAGADKAVKKTGDSTPEPRQTSRHGQADRDTQNQPERSVKNNNEAAKLRKIDEKTVLETLTLTKSSVDKLKKVAGNKAAREGVGLGTDVSRAGEAAFVSALQQLRKVKRQPNESDEQFNTRWFHALDSKIVPKLQQIAKKSDTFLQPDWIQAAVLSLHSLVEEVGSADNIAEVAWDTPAGRELVNVEGHGTSADMFITTKDGRRWGISLKKDADVFVLNAGLGKAIESIAGAMVDDGIDAEKVAQFASHTGLEAYAESLKSAVAQQRHMFKTDRNMSNAFIAALSEISKNPKLQNSVGLPAARLKRFGKDFWDKKWTEDDLKIHNRVMGFLADTSKNPAIQKKMVTESNRIRNLDREATERILATLDDPEIRRGFENVILDGIHFKDALGFGHSAGKLEKFITIYGMKPNGAVLKDETLVKLFGHNNPKYMEVLARARKGDKKAQELISNEARKRLIIDQQDGARNGYIKVRTPNPSPPPSESVLPLFDIGARVRGGGAPVLEIHQTPAMTHMLRNGPDISTWPPKAQINLYSQQIMSLRQRQEDASTTSKQQVKKEIDQLESVIAGIKEKGSKGRKTEMIIREGAVRGPGNKSGGGVARDGAIAQDDGGQDSEPQQTQITPVAPAAPQAKSGKPNPDEDELEQDIIDMDDAPLEPQSPLGKLIVRAFNQPIGEPKEKEAAKEKAKAEKEKEQQAPPAAPPQQEGFGKAHQVTIYAKDRKTVLGHVSSNATSIGASKVVGKRVHQERVNGKYGWVVKEGQIRERSIADTAKSLWKPNMSVYDLHQAMKTLEKKFPAVSRDVIDTAIASMMKNEDYQGSTQDVKTENGEPLEISDDDFREAQKTEPTMVKQMDEPFVVTTKEGEAKGKPGDYLAKGAEGEKWPIDQKIFDKTHKFTNEAIGGRAPGSRRRNQGPSGVKFKKISGRVSGGATKYQGITPAGTIFNFHPADQTRPHARGSAHGSVRYVYWVIYKMKKDGRTVDPSWGPAKRKNMAASKELVDDEARRESTNEGSTGEKRSLKRTTGSKEWGKMRKKGKHSKRNPRAATRKAQRRADKEKANVQEGGVVQVRPDLWAAKNLTGEVRHFSGTRLAELFSNTRGKRVNEDVGGVWRKSHQCDAPQGGGAIAVQIGTEGNKTPNLPPHLQKFVDPKTGELTPDAAKRVAAYREKSQFKDVTPQGYGPIEDEASLSHGGGQSTGSDRSSTHISKAELTPQELKTIDTNWKKILKFSGAAFKKKPYPVALRAIEKYLERMGIDKKHIGKIGEVIAHELKQDTDPVSMIIPKAIPRITQEPNVKGSGHFFGGHPGPFQPV